MSKNYLLEVYTSGTTYNCAKSTDLIHALVQNAEITCSQQKYFLTGTEPSGLTAILPTMEQKVRGDRI